MFCFGSEKFVVIEIGYFTAEKCSLIVIAESTRLQISCRIMLSTQHELRHTYCAWVPNFFIPMLFLLFVIVPAF